MTTGTYLNGKCLWSFHFMTIQHDIIERFPARVLSDLRDVPALQAGSVTLDLSQRDSIMDVIRSHASDPSIFDEREPYVWAAQISNSRVDYYFTRMDPNTTLKNFVADAIDGVAFMDSHDTMHQPVGRSFAATLVERDAGIIDVYAAFYTIPNLQNAKINTSDLIDRIRSGISKDVSVGFKRGEGFEMRCSICGGDMMRWDDCPHFQGVKYETLDDQGNPIERVAIAWIINGRLGEVSSVYDGATPNCMIEKATNFAQRGLLKPTLAAALEKTYRMTLPTRTIFQSGALDTHQQVSNDTDVSQSNEKGERQMADEDVKKLNFDHFTSQLRAVDLIKDGESVTSESDVTARFVTEINRLRAIETQHKEFVTAETEDAIAQGVRAQGDKFDKERYSSLFQRASLTEIRSFRKEWEDKADAELAGGRRGTETGEDDVETTGEDTKDERAIADGPLLPDSVFATK